MALGLKCMRVLGSLLNFFPSRERTEIDFGILRNRSETHNSEFANLWVRTIFRRRNLFSLDYGCKASLFLYQLKEKVFWRLQKVLRLISFSRLPMSNHFSARIKIFQKWARKGAETNRLEFKKLFKNRT